MQGIQVDEKNQIFCSKCRKTMNSVQFYTYKDGSKCELCKSCLTMHVNNFEPDTFMWLLEKFDIPYIESEWNVLRDKAYAKDPFKATGMSVFGRYLSKMKLKQYKDHNTWADTQYWKEKEERDAELHGLPKDKAKQQLEDMKTAFENGEITEAQYQTYAATQTPDLSHMNPESGTPQGYSPYPVNGDFELVDIPNVGNDLSEEDKIYLAIKWGRLYRADQWVALEKLYNEFMNSFDIQGAARLDTLKKICKTSLKMDEAIDAGDVDSYQKLSRVYDAMMKSAKFTEAQNKEGKSDFLDSVGEMVAYCEREGGQIPKYEIETPYDIVDKIIDDLKLYNKTLINEDKSLAEEIENYLKNKEIADNMKRDREEAKRRGLDYVELEDQDFIDFKESLEQQKQEDNELINEEGEDE